MRHRLSDFLRTANSSLQSKWYLRKTIRCRAIVMLLLLLVCPPAWAGEGQVVTVGGVQLDVDVLKNALREQVREELSEAIQSGREQLEGLPGEAADQTKQFLYDEFKRWVRVRIYQELPEAQRQELAAQEILPNDPRFDPHLERWRREKPDEAGMLARAYLLESSAQQILTDLQDGASREIIDGLNDLYTDATEKLQRFTRAVEEAEEAKTPSTDILEKHGFSGPWIEKFKGREAQYRKLQEFNKKYNVVDSLQLLTEAFQAEMPRQRIGAMFGLLEKLGGAAGESRIPIVSFMGQMVENLAKVATEMLAAEERLGAIIRAREGNCLGADTHDLDTPRQKKFHSQFDAAIRICPTDLSPDIYVQDEPSDSSKICFFLNGRFVTGNPEGGGLAGLHQVSSLLEEAAAANFIRYTGKAADPATLAAVYNTPYPPPGDEKYDEKKKRNGTGIPGAMNEAVAVLDGITERLAAMEKLVSGEETCGEEKLHAFLNSATGLNAREYHDAEARLSDDLRLHYVMAYIDRYMAAESETGGGRRTTAYDTYSRIWDKFEDLSLLRVAGRVTPEGSAPCRDCAAATVSGRVAGGGPQVLPVCTAGEVDQYGAFFAFYAMRTADWALAFRAEAGGRRTPEETLNPQNSGMPEPPFVTMAEVVLRLPREKEPEPSSPPKEENSMAGTPPAPEQTEAPPAEGPSSLAGVIAGAIEKCDLDLAANLLDGVSGAVERSALEKALTEKRRRHEEFIRLVKQAEAEALADEPYQALARLKEAQPAAPCGRDRELIAAAIIRVQDMITAIDDGRFAVWVEDALAECRFDDALGFIERISPARRGDLEARARQDKAREDDARSMLEEGRRLAAEGRTGEGLTRLREARALTRCTRQAGAIDFEIARVGQAGPRTCDAIIQGGILRREAGGAERCVCPDGKVPNRAGTACIDKPNTQVASRQCPDNAEAYWDAQQEQARCRCKPGFRYSREENACPADADPDMDLLLGDVAANQQTSDAADRGERQADNTRREKSQYTDSGPSSREREPQGPDLMGGLLQALGTAVAQSQGAHVPQIMDPPSSPWQPGGELGADMMGGQNTPPRESGGQSAGNQPSAEDIARWQQSLDCLREGKRKYPNYWQDCNGSWTMGDRDVEIRRLEGLLGSAGGGPAPRQQAETGGAANEGNDWFIITVSAFPTSDDHYRLFPECRYLVGRGMMFVEGVAGGRREIEASADALRARGHAGVEVIYADGRDGERLAQQWQGREDLGRDACWDAKNRSAGGRR